MVLARRELRCDDRTATITVERLPASVVDGSPVSRPQSALRLLACVLTLCGAVGCGDACLNLAKQICVCLPDDGTRAACNQRASDGETVFTVRPNDQAYCQHLLDTNSCDCTKLNTPAGKAACGLSYPTQAAPLPASTAVSRAP